MADKRISQLVDRGTVANSDVVPIVVSGASTTNKATISSIQTFMQGNLDMGVTSVGLSMPSAFVVSNSPVTASGNISVTGAGTVSQYIRGDGSLADFPSGGGGGGSSVNYYLNGSVSQGTIGGIAYREMNKVPILGAGTDITIGADGYIASFITDAGDPALLEIPAGNWNFESYFSASSGGGSPSFYIELYKVNSGGTATLIASNSATPELISFGTSISPYFSPLAVPTTVLTVTDRLAVRYYVTHSGRTITLHTENSHLCQIITTFTTGLTALNGLTAQVQNFATGTSGTDFGISSASTTHTFNLPTASATNRGALSSADWTTFNNKQNALTNPVTGTGTALEIAYFSGTSSITSEPNLFWNNTLKILEIIGSNSSAIRIRGNTIGASLAITQVNSNTTAIAIGNSSAIIGSGTSNVLFSNTNLDFYVGGSTRWSILSTGQLQSNGAQTIQTSTGNLTLATAAGNGNIVLSPNGTGGVGIGTTTVTGRSLVVGKIITGATTSYGILNNGQIQSDVTSSTRIFNSVSNTTASAFTLSSLVHYYAEQGTFGASSSVTNQWGFYAESNLTGATNNYGFRGAIPVGTNRWNLYMDGTANNYMAGNLLIGTTTDNGAKFQVSGTATVSGSLTAANATFSQSAGNTLQVYQTSPTNSTTAIIRQTGQGGNGNQDIGLVVDIQAAGNLDRIVNFRYFDGTNYNSRFLVRRDGNVGIGTASPLGSAVERTIHLSDGGGGYATVYVTNSANTVRSIFGMQSAGNLGIVGTQTNTPFAVFTNDTEKMRITSDTSAFMRMASGTGGIQFNGDTAAANALDDYEEGTWTPTVTAESGSYTMIFSPRGTYTKIGRVVTLTYYFEVNNKGTGSNACILSSLPFASKSSSSGDTYVGSGIQNSSNNPNQIVLAQNSSSLYIYENTGDPITATLPNTGTITYIT